MALSSGKIRRARGDGGVTEKYAIATGATVYVGSLAMIRGSTGRLVAAADDMTSDHQVAGVVTKLEADSGAAGSGVGDTAGDEYAYVEYGREYQFELGAPIQTTTSLGKNVFAFDDDVVSGTTTGTAAARLKVGELASFAEGTTQGWVRVRNFSDTDVAT